MALTLNHYSIRTLDLDGCRDFYQGVLGLTIGPRPTFPFPGFWMYRGPHTDYANAVVHIIGIDKDNPDGLVSYLGGCDSSDPQGTGVIDHVAFFANGLVAMLIHLREKGIEFRERTVPDIGLHQLFLNDPDGVTVELNYPAGEKIALDSASGNS